MLMAGIVHNCTTFVLGTLVWLYLTIDIRRYRLSVNTSTHDTWASHGSEDTAEKRDRALLVDFGCSIV